jgi:hypothetical protein
MLESGAAIGKYSADGAGVDGDVPLFAFTDHDCTHRRVGDGEGGGGCCRCRKCRGPGNGGRADGGWLRAWGSRGRRGEIRLVNKQDQKRKRDGKENAAFHGLRWP